MCRCCNLSIHPESEHGFCLTDAALDQAAPVSIPSSLGAVADNTITHVTHPNILFISRPMVLEIFEEGGPIEFDAIRPEITQRDRKAVVNADQRGLVFGQSLDKPFRDAAPPLAWPVVLFRWPGVSMWCR